MEIEVEIQKENVTKMKQLQMQSGMNMADFAKVWVFHIGPCRNGVTVHSHAGSTF